MAIPDLRIKSLLYLQATSIPRGWTGYQPNPSTKPITAHVLPTA